MTNKISASEFNRLLDGIARAVTVVSYSFTKVEPSAEWVMEVTRKIGVDYLDELGIDEVEYEDENFDIPDDVNESNYNPYMGCDDYDYDPADIGWDI
jgi:hypothetical protein